MSENSPATAVPAPENKVDASAEKPTANLTHGTKSSNNEKSRFSNQGRGGRGRGQGSRDRKGGGRGFGSKDPNGRQRKKDSGRGDWNRGNVGKRERSNTEQDVKRRKIEAGDETQDPTISSTKNDDDTEERKPKRKVAVMIGYAGTGYKGIQINAGEKTIEGDIFKAFVEAGAISKANANDPKKSSLVRCARTDKGVHAAGNLISLKLIIEDPDIVQKINQNLPDQIRVWGFERTNGGFSCYQSCDSRWYEYLIPTYSFLPPHPQSYLGEKLIEFATANDYLEEYQELQSDVKTFWKEALETYVKPVLDKLDPEMREDVLLATFKEGECADTTTTLAAVSNADEVDSAPKEPSLPEDPPSKHEQCDEGPSESDKISENCRDTSSNKEIITKELESHTNENIEIKPTKPTFSPLEIAIKEVRSAYITAKKQYRISRRRQDRVQEALSSYLGTHNFHNYTVRKNYSDPSAKRVIKSFDINTNPIIINDTEWLSMKVHGQSFMMHQIRKMVGMAALVVRCGTPMTRITESYGPQKISIPKAPGLGLLLERPVFTTYNQRAVTELGREKIDFDKYRTEIDEFKQREIYDRIFREEEQDHQFHSFFHHIDQHKSDYFMWVTAGGITAARTGPANGIDKSLQDESEDEANANGEEG
ncbi:tRNA pseudouridine synthase [Blumeria hordei DH14]|uniref:tRNA pseudouridine synthase 1 n=1 Tax=Blumeria graminis f. sp. hordei (strain DH14) TaxID=546991 RepID=N1JNC3_BLUG1|nr:tRNA pseudouridine synthase [Blumeria hordei DH14]